MFTSICSTLSFIITILAFLYGLYIMRNGGPMCFLLIIFAVGCHSLKELWCITNTFFLGMGQPNISLLGMVGCLLFLCSANYGHLDSIVDEGEEFNKQARIRGGIGMLVVFVMILGFVLLKLREKDYLKAIIMGISFLPALSTSYFSIKHLFLKEDAFGFLKTTRLCNVFILIYIIINWVGMMVNENEILSSICSILVAITVALLTYSCKKGLQLWKTLI